MLWQLKCTRTRGTVNCVPVLGDVPEPALIGGEEEVESMLCESTQDSGIFAVSIELILLTMTASNLICSC